MNELQPLGSGQFVYGLGFALDCIDTWKVFHFIGRMVEESNRLEMTAGLPEFLNETGCVSQCRIQDHQIDHGIDLIEQSYSIRYAPSRPGIVTRTVEWFPKPE